MIGIDGIISTGFKIIDKLIPDPKEKARAKQDWLKLQQDGELKELELSLSAILMEAQSSDPWTSRARPSFLYVMYIIILTSIPVGIIAVFRPDDVVIFTTAFKAWYEAIPVELYTLFGAGYLGYAHNRSKDKTLLDNIKKRYS